MKKKFLSVLMLCSLGLITTVTGCNEVINSSDQTSSKAEVKLSIENVGKNTLEVGETILLNLKVENTNKKAIFVSSNEKVLTISDDGLLLAKGVGKATVHAEIQDDKNTIKSNIVEFSVLAKSEISVTLNVDEPMLIIDQTYTLNPTITGNINNYPVEYTSSDSTVASIDDNGKITALKEGKTKISVIIKDVERASIEFNIFASYVPCESISLSTKQLFLAINEEYEVKPTFTPMNSLKEFTLTSEDNESVKVEGNKIIGLEETYSPVKVTITSGNVSFELKVTVANGENAKIVEEIKAKLDTSLALESTLAKDGNLTIAKLDENNNETSKKIYDFEVYSDNKTKTIYTNNNGGESVSRYISSIEGNIFVNSKENKNNDKFEFDDFANKKIGDNSGEVKQEDAIKQVGLPIVDGSSPKGLSKYIKSTFFSGSKFADSEYYSDATYHKNGDTFTLSVTQESNWDKSILTATIEFEDDLIKTFSSTITSYYNDDYDGGTNFVFDKIEKVTATMNKGARNKSSDLPDYSKMACTSFDVKFKNNNEEKTEFYVGDTVSLVINSEPSTYNSSFDPVNIKLSSPSVATYSKWSNTLKLNKECDELKITASTFNVTKEYTLKIKGLPVKSLSIESGEIGLANNVISGKINVNPQKASSNLEYEVTSENKDKVNIVPTPGTMYNQPSFKFTASEAGKYTLKVTDKLTYISTTKEITIFDNSDAGVVNLIKACNIISDNDDLSNFKLSFDTETTGTISFTYNMEDSSSHKNKLDFSQKFTITNKKFVLDKSTTTHFINKIEFSNDFNGVDYSTLKIRCYNSENDTTENTIILSLNLK